MVLNVTYDSCKWLHYVQRCRQLNYILANSLHWWDAALDPPSDVVYNPGDIAWVLASTALVWIMVPGLGYFYSGLLRRKNALSMIYLSMMTIAVVSFRCVRYSSHTRDAIIKYTPIMYTVVFMGFLFDFQ